MKQYIAIDLKSFYASQECVERELDPLTTNLVMADGSTRNERSSIKLQYAPSDSTGTDAHKNSLGHKSFCRK